LLFANDHIIAVRSKPVTTRDERVRVFSCDWVVRIEFDRKKPLDLHPPDDFKRLVLTPETTWHGVYDLFRGQRTPCALLDKKDNTTTGIVTWVEDKWVGLRHVDAETWENGGELIHRLSDIVLVTIGLGTHHLITTTLGLDP
jgi:hypothetical protein